MWSGKISRSSNDILSCEDVHLLVEINQLHMVQVRLFLTGTELENPAQWKGPIQWAHLWGKK